MRKTFQILSTISFVVATIFIFLAPLKFGLAESGTQVAAPKSIGEWIFFSYPNTFAYILIGVIAFLAILTAITAGTDIFKKPSVMFSMVGWALLILGILIADKHLPPEWKNNTIKFQFLCYGAWFVSANILFQSFEKKRIVLLVLMTAGIIVSLTAISQYNSGLENMRKYVAKEAGFNNFNSYTNFLLTVSNDEYTWLKVRKLAGNRVFSTFVYPNSLGGFLIVLLPICLAMFNSSKEKIVKMLAGLTFFLACVAMILSRSKASIVIAAAMLALVFIFAKNAGKITHKKLAVYISIIIICAGAMLFWGYGTGLTGRLKATGAARGDYWRAAAKMIAENPWKGWGTDGFTRNYPIYKKPTAEATRLAHNAFINVWTDYGITGLIGLMIALLLPIFTGINLLRKRENFNWLSAACLAAGTGFVLHCLVDFDFHIIGITIPALLALTFGMSETDEKITAQN